MPVSEGQLASTGAKSELWLHDGTALYKLVQVKSFKLPSAERERIESTHLASDAKEYVPGDLDFGEFEAVLNLRPGSTTDTLCETLAAGQADVAFKACLAVRGTLTRDYTGTCIVLGYDHGEINRKGVMEATLKLAASGAVTSAAHS